MVIFVEDDDNRDNEEDKGDDGETCTPMAAAPIMPAMEAYSAPTDLWIKYFKFSPNIFLLLHFGT